jgi:hypothetical protein
MYLETFLSFFYYQVNRGEHGLLIRINNYLREKGC